MTFRVDFASQEYFRNPAAAIEKLRGLGSVVEVSFPISASSGPPRPRRWPTRF